MPLIRIRTATLEEWLAGYPAEDWNEGHQRPLGHLRLCDCHECIVSRRDWRLEHINTWPGRMTAEFQSRGSDASRLIEPLKLMNRFIARMGVEMEGAWDEEPSNLHSDGSVTANGPYRGESVSPACNDWNKLKRFIVDNHPDRANESCGFHVHFSFPGLGLYSRIMDKEFEAHFLSSMSAWAKAAKPGAAFAKRLSGRNGYCKKEWLPDQQVACHNKNYHRYTIWNFCHGVHGTAECRLLPMFDDSAMSIKAVQAVKCAVMLFLRRKNPDESALVMELPMEDMMRELETESKPKTNLRKESICV